MVLLEDRTKNKRAALALCELGRPFRLSTAQDAEPGGAIHTCLEIQKANVASRALTDSKADKTRNFFVKLPGEA
jgi:hypothetical protein